MSFFAAQTAQKYRLKHLLPVDTGSERHHTSHTSTHQTWYPTGCTPSALYLPLTAVSYISVVCPQGYRSKIFFRLPNGVIRKKKRIGVCFETGPSLNFSKSGDNLTGRKIAPACALYEQSEQSQTPAVWFVLLALGPPELHPPVLPPKRSALLQ